MRKIRGSLALLLLLLIPLEAGSRDALAIWDSRCEECHSEAAPFAGKYLWDINGQLQGRHHIEDLDRFLNNHYIPPHEIEPITEMLLSHANSAQRYFDECSECHGDPAEFVDNSLWVTRTDVTGMNTGREVGEFLPEHRQLEAEDAIFFRNLFARIAGKPID